MKMQTLEYAVRVDPYWRNVASIIFAGTWWGVALLTLAVLWLPNDHIDYLNDHLLMISGCDCWKCGCLSYAVRYTKGTDHSHVHWLIQSGPLALTALITITTAAMTCVVTRKLMIIPRLKG